MDRQSNSIVTFGGDATRNAQAGAVIVKIEDVLERIIDALTENRVLDIPLRNRRTGNESLIRFPASTEAEAKRFSKFIPRKEPCILLGNLKMLISYFKHVFFRFFICATKHSFLTTSLRKGRFILA